MQFSRGKAGPGCCLHSLLPPQTSAWVLMEMEGPDSGRASPRAQVLSDSVCITVHLSHPPKHLPTGGAFDLPSCGHSPIGAGSAGQEA